MRFIIRIILNAGAILLVAKYVPGIDFSGSWVNLLIFGTVLGILNGVIR